MSQAKEYIVKVKKPSYVDSLVGELRSWNVKVSNVSKVGFVGFSANMGTLISKWFKDDPRIDTIEESIPYELQAVQQITSQYMWYLDRIDQPQLPLTGTYSYQNNGNGVTIYTVDSGISPNHTELAGRVNPVYDPNFPSLIFDPIVDQRIYENSASYNPAFPRGTDELGHGTFIAGLLVSPSYGVAKGAQLRSAKVFGQSATSSGRILAGLNAVYQDYVTRGKPKSVVNLSIASLAPAVDITSTTTATTPNSNFTINGHLLTLVTGTIDEIIFRINALNMTGIVASKNAVNKLVISIKTLGSVTLIDGLNSPLAALGITPSTYINGTNLVEQAIIAMIADGMHIVISAGNYGIDSSLVTPARIGSISSAVVVGSVDQRDRLASFVNSGDLESTLGNVNQTSLTNASVVGSCYGPPVSLYAPGTSMQSAWIPSYNTGTDSYNEAIVGSGTSFSAPLAAGAIALALQTVTITPAAMKTNLISGASSNRIPNLPAGSANKILNITNVDTTIQWVSAGPFSALPLYSFQELFISAVSYLGPITQYDIIDGSLPVGLTLDTATGKISGTIDGSNIPGNYVATIKAYNGTNDSPLDNNGVLILPINVIPGSIPALWNTPENLGKVREGDNVNIILSADNLVNPSQPVTYTVSGNLPFGWILVNDQIIGRAPIATNGDFSTGFTIEAFDGLSITPRSFTITIQQNASYTPDNEPVWITPTGILGSFVEGQVVSIQLQGLDQPVDPQPLTYNLSIADGDGSIFDSVGQLPSGLSLDPTTGIISGTLDTIVNDTETYEFAVYLSDGANVVANMFAIIVIKQFSAATIIWDTLPGNLASLNQNDSVNIQLAAHDTAGQIISYSLISGELPDGVDLSSDGLLSGTITANEDKLYAFTVMASNGLYGIPETFSLLLNKENTAPVWITGSDLGSYPEGSFINILLEAFDNESDQLTFTSSDLPSGLYIQGQYLTGTLDAVDQDTTVSFTITVSDILSNPVSYFNTDQTFTLVIKDGALNPNSPPVWMTPEGPLPSGITNQFYSTSLIAIDPELTPVVYHLENGTLPPGLSLDQINGTIVGTIGLITEDAGYDFIISASDGVFTVNRSFSIFVSSAIANQPPVWVTDSNLGSIVDGVPKVISFIATDPEGTIVTYSYVSGSLPPGMLFNNASGQLSGIPSITVNQQTFQFVIRATDANQGSTDQQFNLIVVKVANQPPVWVTSPGQLTDQSGPITYHPGDYVNFQFQATDPDNGPLPLSYRIASTPLPYGISLSTSGLLTGYIGEVYSDQDVGFTVEVSDGATPVSRNFILKLTPAAAYTGTGTDLYLPLSVDLKQMLKQWNTDDLIPDSILYQPTDPNYGRNTNYDILLTNNLHTGDKNQIQQIFGPHHKAFSSLMGIPTYAIGKDNYGNPIYEVIYIPMLDSQKHTDFNIANQGSLEYISHSFDHIRTEVKALANNEFLPSWMRVTQDSAGTVLGYVPAIVLAYVQPGKAKTVIQTITQIINQTSFNIQETTFDRHVLISEKVNPTITAGAQMAVEGVLVTFTGGDVLSAKNDIESALFAAGVNNVRIYLEDSVEYGYVGGKYVPTFGRALRFNYSNNYLTLTNVTGTPCEDLGFKAQSNVETTFDGQLVHFDYSLILDEKQNIQAAGLTFVGKELVFDRYVGRMTNGKEFQLKWAPDYQQTFYDSHKKEFWSANPPVWVTPPGELGYITTELPATIQLRTKHHLADQIVSYELVFGSLPPGFTLNSSTGIISGVAGEEGNTTFFTVRAYDKWGNYKDRGFTLTVDSNLLRIKQFIILLNGYGIKI